MATMTVASCLQNALTRLQAAGIEGARLDVRILLATALGKEPSFILGYPEHPVNEADCARFDAMISRRVSREPVSRILGRREFWSLSFRISADTLDPRPDSETLISTVLERVSQAGKPVRILDLGTGTGCLLLTLLHELPEAIGVGVDLSPGAVEIASLNATDLGLSDRASFRVGDWCNGLGGDWDVIISNPPYIGEGEKADLEPEVLNYDPPMALFAGEDGMLDYRALIPQAVERLSPGGFLVIEAGIGQADQINQIMSDYGLICEAAGRDLGGIARACIARKATA
ncbi:peptide chain release factor N(5)-glutamine methyltransferase [Kiloniella laminariae]|uniref:Release factor glutamine methyltransferase n=1 Tax=Kiloniella laminariae TaxID=454162 RepID=A0ABT4LMN1_9PROT|nr:peptide chain release factor N(5)-glutamine methyltransferase [Kiloniella laminariae]MCZ4282150.1 peptide chain release factor N(5)-glutamine methyltransferase [Kiloniella laminariae]